MNTNSFILIFLLFLSGCNKDSVNWFSGTLDEAISSDNNKLIMIDFYTDW